MLCKLTPEEEVRMHILLKGIADDPNALEMLAAAPVFAGRIAVKSGTSVYNGDSKKKQIDNFLAASKRAQQAHKAFMPVVGYGYGKRNPKKEKFYKELAGKDFWEWLTGDPNFYTKIISYMGTKPEEFTSTFENSYANAQNRMLRDFTKDYCKDDGSIDWDKLIKFNSGD